MIVQRIEGATRTIGKDQGYIPLPIRDEMVGDTPTMTSCYELTPAELSALMSGGKLYLTVMGTQHPPVNLFVGT